MKANAVVAVGPRKIEWREVTIPEPGDEDVVVRVTHSWISNGTEGSFVRGERIAGDTPISAQDPSPFPHIPGYQKVGVVERVGSRVTEFAPGQKVFVTVSRVQGMFFEYAGHISPSISHRSQVWRLPDSVDPVAASGLVLTQVGYNVGMRPVVVPGDAAVVLGDGMVGHWAAQTLQQRGAFVLLVGRHDDRLARFALRPGDGICNINRENLSDIVRAFAPNRLQALCDTVGSIETIDALLPHMRHGGHLSSAGFYGPNGQIDIQKLRNGELTLHAPAGWSRQRMDATLALLTQGALTTTHLITHRFTVQRAADAFDLILAKAPGALGIVLDWEES
jgi:2-desacetyl-2-hydroxyethyl bacteriochlorophyllide A dehydrogenase